MSISDTFTTALGGEAFSLLESKIGMV